MLKKKYVIMLSLFVVMLCLNLSSTSYAFNEKSVKNLIYNYYSNSATQPNNWQNIIDNYNFSNLYGGTTTETFDTTIYFDNDNYKIIAFFPYSTDMYITVFNTSNTNKSRLYLSGNRYVLVTSRVGYFRLNTNNGNLQFYNSSNNNVSFTIYGPNYFYSEIDLWNSNNTSISFPSTYIEPSWFNASGIYDVPEPIFDFEMNTTNATEYLYIDTEDGRVTNIPVIYRWDFGTLINTTDFNYLNDNLVMYYWNGNIWKRKQFFIRDLVGKKLTSNAYINISNNATFTEYTMSIPQLFQYNNVLYIYDIMNENNESATATFIVGDGTTSIVNGTINTNFSGDYSSQFDNLDNIINNNNNTNDILDALTNDNYSGDLTLNDLPSIEVNDISSDFFTWLLTQFLNVINSTNNVYLEIPIYNNTYRIASNSFVLDVQPLKTFISAGWWFICGVPFLKFIRRTIEHLKGGNVPLSDDKSDLLGNIL